MQRPVRDDDQSPVARQFAIQRRDEKLVQLLQEPEGIGRQVGMLVWRTRWDQPKVQPQQARQLLNTGENFDSFAIMVKHVSNGFRAIVGQHPKTSLIVGAQLTRQVAFIDFEEWMKEHIAEGSNLEKAANLIIAFNMKDYEGRPMMGQRCLKYRGGNPMWQSLHDCDLRYYYISEVAHHDPDAMG